jgi:hypothetical protein
MNGTTLLKFEELVNLTFDVMRRAKYSGRTIYILTARNVRH